MKKEVSLYLHIPFCLSKCNYCDFRSFAGMKERKEGYIKYLCKEIELYKDILDGYEVSTIYFGGGTPSFLEVSDIENIMACIYKYDVKKDAEITMEVNPGTTNFENLKKLRSLGINRLSIGLQSSNDKLLKLIGRVHTYGEFRDCFFNARNAGFDNINIDVMFALPTQTMSEYEETLNEVIDLSPEHISAYSLTLEEGTPLNDMVKKGEIEAKSEEEDRLMYDMTIKKLKEYGYDHYEISNFSKPSRASKHNMVYWNAKEYLGLGLAAHSHLLGHRFSNTEDMDEYEKSIRNGKLSLDNKDRIRLTDNDMMSEYMFLGLRVLSGISIKDFEERFETDFEKLFGNEVSILINQELLEKNGDIVKLTRLGLDLSNYVFANFII